MTTGAVAHASAASALYAAELHPLNTGIGGGDTTGKIRIAVRGDALTISIHVERVAPGIELGQHFHGFKDGRAAACPTVAADVNHDGVIDLIEVETTSGTTMVPFNGAPTAMHIPTETSPLASANGSYSHEKTVSLSALQAAFAKAYGSQGLELNHRVIFIHGVPATAKLPASAASWFNSRLGYTSYRLGPDRTDSQVMDVGSHARCLTSCHCQLLEGAGAGIPGDCDVETAAAAQSRKFVRNTRGGARYE